MLAMPAQRADSSIQSSSRWPMPRRRWEGRTASSTRCARSSPNSMIAKPVRAPRDVPLLPLSQATTASVSRSRMARSTRAASYFHPSPASMKSRDIIPIAWASRGSAGRGVEAVSTMARENLGSLVVMEQGRMVGMLTFHELLRALASRGGALDELRVGDIMVRDPVTAAPEMEVNDLRRTMLESGARYLPVIQDGRLLGVISFRDVAKAVLEEQDFENKMLKGYIKNWPA